MWVSRGRYALPQLDLDVMTAHGMRGVLSHESAALWHGWELRLLPEVTHLTVPKRRRVAPGPKVALHRVDLRPDDVVGHICTSPYRTLLDCLRTLPPDDALAVADSALRHGLPRSVLDQIARTVRGPRRPAVLRAVRHADARAANPFESALRSIAMQVEGLEVQPQLTLHGSRQVARPDLVDLALRVLIEADSFGWHGDRAALRRDARRYNHFTADGWLVLRFTWEDVMYDRDYVLDVLRAVVATRKRFLDIA